MPTDAQTYVYFVSYSYGAGFGAIEVHQDEPVSAWRHVDGFARLAAEAAAVSRSQIVILNFQLLSGGAS